MTPLNLQTEQLFKLHSELNIIYESIFTLFSQGIKQMGQDSGYEKTSEVFMDLLTLLKSRFHHFAENINKQV